MLTGHGLYRVFLLVSHWPKCLCRYLITAPLSLHLDATETVLLQLFGFTDPVRVYVFLRTSLAPGNVILDQTDATLDTNNKHQAVVRLRVRHSDLRKTRNLYKGFHCHDSHFYLLCIFFSLSLAVSQQGGQEFDPGGTPCPITRDQPAPVCPHQPRKRFPVHTDGQAAVHTTTGR